MSTQTENGITQVSSITAADYPKVLATLRNGFIQGKSRPIEYRQQQLRQLAQMLEDNRQSWKEALRLDMGRCDFEAELCELVPVVAEAMGTHNELKEWTKPEKAKTGTINAMDGAYVQREPLGLCLIVSSWNYPLQYTLTPLIGAIAAGNVVVIKASDKCPATTNLLRKLFPKYMDCHSYVVIAGGEEESSSLLEHKFDFVFFTGKRETGKKILKAVADHLTPVSLHLGGKNPVYVDASVDCDKVARCLIWGKMMNAGQNCAAPDYVLCRKEVLAKLVEAIKKTVAHFYGNDPKQSQHFGRIVNKEEFQRVAALIEASKVVVGGDVDEEQLYIAPTVMTNVSAADAIMQEEVFGPVLPIMTVSTMDEAVLFINAREKPLAVYCFSKENSLQSKFSDLTSSGGYCGNDVLSQLSLSTLPNGGVGASGFGTYHGFFTFDAFSHRKAVLMKKLALEGTLKPRYPPYTEGHLNLAKNALKKKFKGNSTNNNRNGQEISTNKGSSSNGAGDDSD